MKSKHTPRTTGQKVLLGVIIIICIGLVVAIGVILYFAYQKPTDLDSPGRVEFPDPIFSVLTGEQIPDAAMNQSPTFCVQIPNGKDGGRPQAGLNQAGVVFEAIAEAGITRFAAIFQNPTVSVIGPIRSLRPYYLDWDTPFDCTVVHAGGSDEAIAALQKGGQRHLNESTAYMWREARAAAGGRGWNNLMTSSSELLRFNADKGWNTSNVAAFARYTPEETSNLLQEKLQNCAPNTVCETASAPTIQLNFGAIRSYNVVYNYNPETNSYLRSYANGEAHTTYSCPADLVQPHTLSACGDPVQLSPSVVIAMVVRESLMSDNYHQQIQTIGSGTAYIFQNGDAIEGTWEKSSQRSQIVFRDHQGNVIKLNPGQTWISAIPHYGSILY